MPCIFPCSIGQSVLILATQVVDDEKENPGQMAYAYKMTWIWAITLSIVIFVLWPLLALPAGIFTQGYFTFWVILSMVSPPFVPDRVHQFLHGFQLACDH